MLKTIQLLAHSGFVVELPQAYLVFDYFQDPTGVMAKLRHTAKPVLFFSTHHHHDHWRPEILDFPEKYDFNRVHFILDHTCFAFANEDVQGRLRERLAAQKLTVVRPGDVVATPELAMFGLQQIRVTGSTDAGSSFCLLTAANELLFFAGDLNDWDWQDEHSPKMAEDFADELQKVKQSFSYLAGTEDVAVDFAFVPLDLRLGIKADQGPLRFISVLKPLNLVPMHLANGVELPALLQQKTAVNVIQSLVHPGDFYFC